MEIRNYEDILKLHTEAVERARKQAALAEKPGANAKLYLELRREALAHAESALAETEEAHELALKRLDEQSVRQRSIIQRLQEEIALLEGKRVAAPTGKADSRAAASEQISSGKKPVQKVESRTRKK